MCFAGGRWGGTSGALLLQALWPLLYFSVRQGLAAHCFALPSARGHEAAFLSPVLIGARICPRYHPFVSFSSLGAQPSGAPFPPCHRVRRSSAGRETALFQSMREPSVGSALLAPGSLPRIPQSAGTRVSPPGPSDLVGARVCPRYLSIALFFLLLGAQPSGGHVFCRATESSAPLASVIFGRAGDHPVPARARAPRGFHASPSGLIVSRSPQCGSTKFVSWLLGSCRGSNLSPLPLHFTFSNVGRPIIRGPACCRTAGSFASLVVLDRARDHPVPASARAQCRPNASPTGPAASCSPPCGNTKFTLRPLGRGSSLPPLRCTFFDYWTPSPRGPAALLRRRTQCSSARRKGRPVSVNA
ncbi:hypothetical protein NDU88_000488 [Pleurodeles waltl]|uniref:Secreted protein n=1 Tax=Pleurodeles waltl TaxID=8319 RepID=A0AAV7UR89_PLEWA|nr:hypothetical protein NDU88_000488 [Pleurodeles waltl]